MNNGMRRTGSGLLPCPNRTVDLSAGKSKEDLMLQSMDFSDMAAMINKQIKDDEPI